MTQKGMQSRLGKGGCEWWAMIGLACRYAWASMFPGALQQPSGILQPTWRNTQQPPGKPPATSSEIFSHLQALFSILQAIFRQSAGDLHAGSGTHTYVPRGRKNYTTPQGRWHGHRQTSMEAPPRPSGLAACMPSGYRVQGNRHHQTPSGLHACRLSREWQQHWCPC